MKDTLKLATELHPGKKNSLDALCERYGVNNTHRTLHGALLDAELLVEVYLAMTRGQESLAMELEQALAAAASAGDVPVERARLDEGQFSDWSLPDRGVIRGEALQNFINHAIGQRPLEKLPRLFAAVATDLQSGEAMVFRTGNTGMAVRASSSVPGVFQPVKINGREYVDGGLVSPVPVKAARDTGADFVIAVDISYKPQYGSTYSTIDVLLQTFAIMGQSIGRYELSDADVVIRPQMSGIKAADFQDRHKAVLEGEKAVAAALPEIKAKLAELREGG